MADEPIETESTADCWAGTNATSPCAMELQSDGENASTGRAGGFASFGALLSAFIASSWCWLPPLLILGGVSGAGMTTFAEQYRPILMAVTAGLLGWAFYVTYRSNVRSKVMTFNKVILWAVTGVVVVMLFFPTAVSDFVATGDQITADMDRTVIAIEGMTWHTWQAKAEQAIRTAPGVLAVIVDFETKQAAIGTRAGGAVPTSEILAALESIGYQGQLVEHPPAVNDPAKVESDAPWSPKRPADPVGSSVF